MDHVEVLILLHKRHPDALSMDDIVRETGRPVELISNALNDLSTGGLVSSTPGAAGVESFRYDPQSEPLRSVVNDLAAMYNERPVTLIRAVYDRPAQPVLSFAEAFRLRGGEA
jgi:hypothetical protein